LQAAQDIAGWCQRRGVNPSQFALAWCLANPILTSIILGPRTMEQFDDNVAALNVAITAEDEAFIDSLVTPGHASTPGFNDVGHFVPGRVPRTS
jgi:aryl-alcohol dehydrogenase-like predicted oxidoreductase